MQEDTVRRGIKIDNVASKDKLSHYGNMKEREI